MFERMTPILLGLAALFALAGCGSDDDPTRPAPAPADLESFFTVLPSWEAFSPRLADADVPLGEETTTQEVIGGAEHDCTTVPYSITRTPERIVTLNPDSEILWVGSLLQGRGYLNGLGSLAELSVRQRSPLSLSIDLLTDDTSATVEDPDLASVTAAVGGLVQRATDSGHRAGSNVMFTQETAYSLQQAFLKMGLSASYTGASVETSLSANISEEKRTVTAYFVQRMFTVSMVLPQTPAGVFSEEFTAPMLAAEIERGRMGEDNLPVYVSSITYGRLLMFSFTSAATVGDISTTLSLVFNQGGYGGGTSLESRYQEILETAEIEVVTVGGDAENAQALIRSNNLGAYFDGDAPLTTARPISYTIRNLKDNTLARVSETTEYNLQECIAADNVATGAEFTIQLTQLKGVGFPTIDPFPPHVPRDRFNAEIYYTFRIRNDAAPEIAARFEWTVLRNYAERIDAGQYHALRNTHEITVKIHFDGRDEVHLYGDVWDDDSDILPGDADRIARYDRTFKWPANPLVARNYGMTAGDGDGNRVRLFWTVTKVRDLFD